MKDLEMDELVQYMKGFDRKKKTGRPVGSRRMDAPSYRVNSCKATGL